MVGADCQTESVDNKTGALGRTGPVSACVLQPALTSTPKPQSKRMMPPAMHRGQYWSTPASEPLFCRVKGSGAGGGSAWPKVSMNSMKGALSLHMTSNVAFRQCFVMHGQGAVRWHTAGIVCFGLQP